MININFLISTSFPVEIRNGSGRKVRGKSFSDLFLDFKLLLMMVVARTLRTLVLRKSLKRIQTHKHSNFDW